MYAPTASRSSIASSPRPWRTRSWPRARRGSPPSPLGQRAVDRAPAAHAPRRRGSPRSISVSTSAPLHTRHPVSAPASPSISTLACTLVSATQASPRTSAMLLRRRGSRHRTDPRGSAWLRATARTRARPRRGPPSGPAQTATASPPPRCGCGEDRSAIEGAPRESEVSEADSPASAIQCARSASRSRSASEPARTRFAYCSIRSRDWSGGIWDTTVRAARAAARRPDLPPRRPVWFPHRSDQRLVDPAGDVQQRARRVAPDQLPLRARRGLHAAVDAVASIAPARRRPASAARPGGPRFRPFA